MSSDTEWIGWITPDYLKVKEDTRTDLEKRRDEMYYNILRQLNNAKRPFQKVGGLFECGELGIVDIWFGRNTWEHRWRDMVNAEQFLKDGKR